MRSNIIKVTLVLLLLSSGVMIAQQSVFFQGSQIDIAQNIKSKPLNNWPDNSSINQYKLGWMQFNKTPQIEIQERLKNNDVTLIEYLGEHTYLVKINSSVSSTWLQQQGVIGITPLTPAMKMSANLKKLTIGHWATDGKNVLVNLQSHKEVIKEDIIAVLKNNRIKIIEDYPKSNFLKASIPSDRLEEIANINLIKYIEVIEAPSVKEDTDGRGLHRSSNLDTQTSAGRNYTGDGIGVLVRDDGIVGPHIDFQGRIDNSGANGSGQTHGDGVAGILAGAGNLDPRNRGMAAGSNVYVSNYSSSFQDATTTSLIANNEVQITNSSYGNGCNDGYTTLAQRVDQQTTNNPSLLHVFSAGNSGSTNCGYGVTGWGNITGGHKQGKNVIATANTNDNATLATSSSKGPATDGRIKPDITAHGQGHISTNENNQYMSFGGTSGAAPGIAGVAAQLYEVYQTHNNNNLPKSGLIKAVLLNTASDYGNIGPDFRYGWGMVNALRAGELIEDGRFLTNSISQGNQRNHTINIPNNTAQVKVMLYWTDVAAAAGANKALVNDLDMTITQANGSQHNPYILNSSPNIALLNQPATTGVDRLNNMEQIVIDNPAAGSLSIDINGFDIPMGTQEYFIVYDIIDNPLRLTYPTNGESFTAGEIEIIQWDATNPSSDFTLQYSTNNGTSWNNITTVSSNLRLYNWLVPTTISGQCLVRVRNNSSSSTSSTLFSIANTPGNMTVTQACPNHLTVTWPALAGANTYELYLLGNEEMEIVGRTNLTTFDIPITNPSNENWFAIRALGGNGWTSMRTVAQNYNSGLLNCVINNDLAVTSINNSVGEFQSLCNPGPVTINATIENLGTQDASNFDIAYQFNNNAVITEPYSGTLTTGSSINHSFTTPLQVTGNGLSSLRVFIVYNNDQQNINDEQVINFNAQDTSTQLDITEDFETNGVFPPAWILDNPDGDITWVGESSVIGVTGSLTTAVFIDNADYSDRGEIDSFTTGFYDLNFNGTATLSFDLAKAQWSPNYNDRLEVEISTDCGNTFTSIYSKNGLALATVPYITSEWVPARPNDWRNETIDLTPYVGNNIVLKFVMYNDYSNSTYIDNIALNRTLSNQDHFGNRISIYPNPASSHFYIDTNGLSGQNNMNIIMYNSLGQKVYKTQLDETITKINCDQMATGMYFINLSNGSQSTIKKILIK